MNTSLRISLTFLTLCLVNIICSPFLFAQQPNFCGTVQTEEDLTWLRHYQESVDSDFDISAEARA
ncbi:MAG: hypothetical protein ACI959_001100, partial [Limisphaerales bacterium]